jgi:hypothetical protein
MNPVQGTQLHYPASLPVPTGYQPTCQREGDMPGHTETRLIMDEVGLYQLQMAPMGVQSKSHAGTRVTRSPGTRGNPCGCDIRQTGTRLVLQNTSQPCMWHGLQGAWKMFGILETHGFPPGSWSYSPLWDGCFSALGAAAAAAPVGHACWAQGRQGQTAIAGYFHLSTATNQALACHRCCSLPRRSTRMLHSSVSFPSSTKALKITPQITRVPV